MALLGGTTVIYDGALDYPGPDRLWSLVERHGVNILGVSPTLIRSLMRHGDEPVRRHDLSSLRILGSTGEPWNPEPWRWFFDVVGDGRLPIINYSGGTEVSGGLLAGCVLTPLKPAAFSGPPPGIAADVVDDRGQPVRGQVGELVVRAPWMGMTHGFWNDTAALRGDVLVAFSRHVGPRGLGRHRRRRALVRPGPVRRHHQDRGQAPGAGRSRVDPGGAPGRARSGRRRHPRRDQGPGAGLLLRAEAGLHGFPGTRRPSCGRWSSSASASRCGRRSCTSSPTCRRRATPRSCAA